ncbi:MAG TPA: TIGR00288 family NYN domain-containing protein [Methanothermococcus okinawensis]|uniref:TIGR00288 family NYN domain-containing protein n=1 Tax=Methanothermococcus okinawensis TaxID=155863 RepID=A0A832ZCS5_9EURY|nr:TIGR00288 family NYN domain-containing protein [Methanothermococcus okinawensis]HIP91318.1 TIGR00288 family NYN domain-containing protein [Methanothermococcus okinawensis]
MWGKLKKICIKKGNDNQGKDRIALLIDGPNMLRKEFNIDLDKIREVLSKFGKIVIGRVYLNQYASDKLIEAITNQGFEPKVTAGDVDVEMAVEGTELIFNKNIDTIAYMTRDADFLPAMRKAKEHGKKIIVIGAEPGFSLAIQNIADHVIKIEDDFTFDREKVVKKKEKKVSEEELEEEEEKDPKEEDNKESLINKINLFKN